MPAGQTPRRLSERMDRHRVDFQHGRRLRPAPQARGAQRQVPLQAICGRGARIRRLWPRRPGTGRSGKRRGRLRHPHRDARQSHSVAGSLRHHGPADTRLAGQPDADADLFDRAAADLAAVVRARRARIAFDGRPARAAPRIRAHDHGRRPAYAHHSDHGRRERPGHRDEPPLARGGLLGRADPLPVPKGTARIRVSLSAALERADILQFVEACKNIG